MADWRYYLIFIFSLVIVITSGVSYFTARKLSTTGQETEVSNIERSSLGSFIASFLIFSLVSLVIFARHKIVNALSDSPK